MSILFMKQTKAICEAFSAKGLDLKAELENGFAGFNALSSETLLEKAFSEQIATMEASHASAISAIVSEKETVLSGMAEQLALFTAKETELNATIASFKAKEAELNTTISALEADKANLCAETLKQDRQTPVIKPNVEGAQDHVSVWKSMAPGKEAAEYFEKFINTKKQEG